MLNPLLHIQAIILALTQIWTNKVRSILTIMGIIFGVWAVTTVVAAIAGVTSMVLSEFEALGGSKMFIFPDRPDDAPRNKYPWELIRLKPQELLALSTNCPSIESITPETELGATVQHGDRTREVNVRGIWPSWHDIQKRTTLMGRPFTLADEENMHQVCLVNEDAISELSLPTDPTGEYLLLNDRRFLIIGLVENEKETMFDQSVTGTDIIIPFSTAVKMQHPEFFFMMIAKLRSPEVVEEAKAEAKFVLRHMRHLGPGDPDTFEIFAADEFIEGVRNVARILTVGGFCVVAVSLLVGGIGIMNIMLVSVSERTREIGLRKAVGATPMAVLMQFLLEAITLCLVGGVIGIVFGEATALALSKIPSIKLEQAAVPWWAIVMSFTFCAATGVIFGMFPAIKAARLDPIDALRHE